MNKEIVFSNVAKDKLLNGVSKISKAVVATLGPSGRNVLIEQEDGNPTSTKDGVTVAKSINLVDRVENVGAQLIKQASIKTAEQAGDGTTTSMLLAAELFESGLEEIDDSPELNVVEIKRGIDIAVSLVVDSLKNSYSKNITDESQLKQIASISANNDSEVGELIAGAMDSVGRDGVVTIEDSKTGETYLETVEGMQFNRGFKSPYFVTDNNTMQAVLKDPFVLVTDKRLSQAKELLPLLESVSTTNKSLLIIADDVEGEILSTLIVNKMRGIIQCVAVKAPEFGDKKKAVLEDIAVLTGGQVVSADKGMKLDKFDRSWLGSAKKVTVGKDTTTIIDAQGDEDSINTRIEEIKQQIDNAISPYEKETLQDRLAKFIGGVAIVHVGGHTELEMTEKKDRVEDALHATKAALEEGILPGGGVALYNSAKLLKAEIENPTEGRFTHPQQLLGARIVANACEVPFYQILWNAGYDDEDIKSILADPELTHPWVGFNPREGKVVNMFDAGIIDPTKVVRLALENASSVAGTMLITEAVVYNKEKKKNKPSPTDMLLG